MDREKLFKYFEDKGYRMEYTYNLGAIITHRNKVVYANEIFAKDFKDNDEMREHIYKEYLEERGWKI